GTAPHEIYTLALHDALPICALILSPDLLLLDEPFSALDVGLKLELYALLRQQVVQRGSAVLLITHDLMEAVRLADRILLMVPAPGRLVHEFVLDKIGRASCREKVDMWVAGAMVHSKDRER